MAQCRCSVSLQGCNHECGAVQATFQAAADEVTSLDTLPDLGLAIAAGLLHRGMVKVDNAGRVNGEFTCQIVGLLLPACCQGML